MKKKIKTFIKILISLLLIYFVLSKVDFKSIVDSIKKADFLYLLLAFFMFNISKIISNFRLNIFLSELNIKLDTYTSLTLYYIGMFYNLFLPGGIGGDGYKIYLLKKYFNKKLSSLINILLMDRISGLLALVFLASILFIFSKYSTTFHTLVPLCITTMIFIYPISYFVSKKFKLFDVVFFKTTLYSIFVQTFQVFSALFIVYALHSQQILVDMIFLFLLSSIVSVIPISVGGIGLREVTFLYGLELINYPTNIGIAFGFLFFAITFISSFIGVFFLNKTTRLFKNHTP